MHRSPLMPLFLAGLLCILFAAQAVAQPTTAANVVKATATTTKPDANGKQTVTIILDIDKDCTIYANPVGIDSLEGAQTRVKVSAKEAVRFDVKYPAGTVKDPGRDRYFVFQQRAVIEAVVTRAKGDASPLQISVHVQGFVRDAV